MIKQHWENLSAQEQRTVKWGGIALAILIFIKFIWWPLSSRIDRLKEDIHNEKALIEWMKPTVAALQKTPERSPSTNHKSSPLSAIEKTFSQAGLSPFVKSLSQNTSDQIVLQVQNIPFSALIQCLNNLDKQYGIAPNMLTATKQKSGVVDAEIIF